MFYVIEVTEGIPEVAGKGMYEREDLTSAEALFHQKMGAAKDPKNRDKYDSELAMVVDSEGVVYRSEKYTKPVAEELVDAE